MQQLPELTDPSGAWGAPAPSIANRNGTQAFQRIYFQLGSAVMLALGVACSGGNTDSGSPPPEAPIIQSFSASPNPITAGRQTTLNGVYYNGKGSVDHGLTYFPSGYYGAVYVKQDTIFTLTVANDAGANATANTTVHVTLPPVGFHPTGNPGVDRSKHTATLLADGKVLLVGGSRLFGYPSNCEVYDPTVGTFKTVGPSMPMTSGQTATRLQNGKVLLAGGGSGVAIDGVELPLASTLTFDPTSATFSGGPVMGTARAYHSATLLPNGQVLIAGGLGLFNSNTIPLSSAELYDPVTNTCKPTGSMVNVRSGFNSGYTAMLLANGKVLIIGDDRGTTSAELYDPTTGTFTSTGSTTASRLYLSATVLKDGKVLVVGGPSTAIVDLYDPATGSFTPKGSFDEMVGPHTATLLLDGTVLFAGGGRDGGYYGGGSAYAWRYDPTDNSIRDTGSMMTPRQYQSATLLPDGKVLIAGGQVASAEVYGFTTP